MWLLALARCGTPVIAFEHGAVPEVIEDGKTGFIVNDMDEMKRALQHLKTIDREECHRVFEERFSASRMARDYVAIYQQLLESKRTPAGKGHHRKGY